MSGQPDLCVDIFSALANMLTAFNNNLNNGGETFSHSDGFTTSTDPTATTQVGGDLNAPSYEDQVNQCSFYLFVGSMILYLVY